MEDFIKIVVSLVVAIVYFLYQSSKNVAKQSARRGGTMPSQEQPVKPLTPTKVSFEQLLKELEEKIQQQLPEPPKEYSIEDRKKNRDERKPEARVSSKPFSYDDKYQSVKAEARPSMQKAAESVLGAPRIQTLPPATEAEPLTVHPVVAMLQNPETLRNAFVLSEIFHRKW